MHSHEHSRARQWTQHDHPGRRFGRHFGPGGPGGPGEGDGDGRGRGRGRMRRGDIRTAILAVLVEGPGHGYDIMSRLEEKSGGAWRPSAGSVYPTLQQLDDEGLVTSAEADGKRVFTLTEAGAAESERRIEEAGGEPWANQGQGVHPGHLFRSISALGLAAKQVVIAGTANQLAASIAIVDKARQEIYRLLADGDPVPTTPTDEPDATAAADN